MLPGMGMSCTVAMQTVRVIDGIMGETLEVKQQQSHRCKSSMSWKRSASSMCQLLRLLLILLGPASSFFPQQADEKNLSWPLKLPRKFEIYSPPATSQKQSLVEYPSFASALTAQATRGKFRRSGRDRRAAPMFQMGSY